MIKLFGAKLLKDYVPKQGRCLAIISAFALFFLSIVFISEQFGWGFGFQIWPQGEERNWVSMMMDSESANMVKAFWKIDGRNPISGWFWYLISSFVLRYEAAIYFWCLFVSYLLSIVLFLLLDQLGKNRSSFFAVSAAILTFFWHFTTNRNGIFVSSYIAIVFTMLSLLFYCKYIDNERRNNYLLLLSICSYFIAFTTYTLQAGAIIGVALIGVYRSSASVKEKIKFTVLDLAFYAFFFIIYNLIWFETTGFPTNPWQSSSLIEMVSLFFTSIGKIIFPLSLSVYFTEVTTHWPTSKILFLVISGFLIFLFGLYKLFSKGISKEIQGPIPYFWIFALLSSIALPTLLVESTSSIFKPGYRSPFSEQVFFPLFCLTVIFFVASLFSKYSNKLRLVLVSIFGAITLTTSLFYNNILLEQTYYQKGLVEGIEKLALPPDKKINFVVKVDHSVSPYIGKEPMLPIYAKTVLKNKNAFIRTILNFPPPTIGHEKGWRVIFNDDNVVNSGSTNVSDPSPYTEVLILYYNGKTVEVPKTIDKSFFEGLQVEWRRKELFTQNYQETK